MFQEDGRFRVLEGPEGGDEAPAGAEFDLQSDVVRIKFKKFVKEFSYAAGSGIQFTQKYREQFMQNVKQGIYRLQVSLNDFTAHPDGEVLRHNLKEKPTSFVPMCEQALKELYLELIKRDGDNLPEEPPPIQLLLTAETDLEGTFGNLKPMMIRDLVSNEVEKLVVVQGIVSSMRPLRHKARKIVIECQSCENQKQIYVQPGLCAAHIPASCEGNSLRGGGQVEKCPRNPYVVKEGLCEYVDEQMLKLQELPEHVPVGEMPRAIDVSVQHYNVDQCTPGTRLTLVGIFCATEHAAGDKIANARQRGTNTVKYSYVQALGIEVAQGNMVGRASIEITPQEVERFEAMAKSVDDPIRPKIFASIAPAIRSSEKDCIKDVKQAVAVLLFGGSRKQLADGTRMRGDINVLLLGDPGTAKSQFLKFTEKCAPIAVYTSGKGSSAAGLTAAIRNTNDGFVLEGGAMVLADGGVVCIDEFDKMDVKDRVAIHEAMEQQTISIAKAGITTMLNTRCSVLAAANPRFGSYDDLQNTADQMDFETTILSRFDMMFLVRDVPDPDRDHGLAMHLAALHAGEAQEDSEGPLTVSELRKYISYCRSKCQPRISKEAGDVLKNHYVAIRKEMRQDAKSSIPITVRQLEAIVRMSESLAKMELNDSVSISHVEEALRLFTVSTLDSANKDRGVGIETLSEAEAAELQKAEEQIKKIIPRGSRKNKFTLHNLLVSTTGIDERIANRAIHIMQMRGELVEKANGTLQRAG
jgi:DNA replication licensing factor MCM5